MALSPPNASNAGLCARQAAKRDTAASTLIHAIVTVCTRWIRRIATRGAICSTEAIHSIMALYSHLRLQWIPPQLAFGESCRRLADILTLARMLNKLLAKAFLRVRCSLERVQRNLEVPLTIRAGANGWHGAQPLRDSQAALGHCLGAGAFSWSFCFAMRSISF
jgi:hypothetical protein